jgi:transcriptional regulator GlxA family with amidase domain
MARLRQTLLKTDLAFSVIAERNGDKSRTSFSQSFKRIFGYAPSVVSARQES